MTIALVIISLVALAAVGLAVWLIVGSRGQGERSLGDSAVGKSLDMILKETQALKVDQKISQESSKNIKDEMRSLSEIVSQFKAHQEERNRQDAEHTQAIQKSIKSMESLFSGSKSKGMAGENILREIFKLFPPEMIVFDYRIEGKPVEFGLKLPDGRIMPIDSKVVAMEEMAKLETEQDEETRRKLIKKIEAEVSKKIKEVSSYVHPPITWDRALMAVPDALYSVLKESIYSAHSQSVILVSYSMAMPYLLTFWDMYKRTLATYDEQQVESFLEELDRVLNEMETVLENQVARGNTMIGNAYNEYKRLVGKVRGRMTYLAEAEKPALAAESETKEGKSNNG